VSADELVAIVRRMVRRASGGVSHDLDDAVQETLCRLLALDAHTFGTTRAPEGDVRAAP
jgi:DNA-directed RNA polymerase specialized sigma24 family protein